MALSSLGRKLAIAAFAAAVALGAAADAQAPQCPWMLADAQLQRLLPYMLDMRAWLPVQIVPRPVDRNERLLLLRRVPPQAMLSGPAPFTLGSATPQMPAFSSP